MNQSLKYFFAAATILFLASCATTQMPYHGFASQTALNEHDATVIQQSAINGPMDPMNLAQDGQEYSHDGNAFDRVEEGYYRWGARLYDMGYRDVYYIADLAPRAMGHEIMDTYEHDIEQGFNDAAKDAEHK